MQIEGGPSCLADKLEECVCSNEVRDSTLSATVEKSSCQKLSHIENIARLWSRCSLLEQNLYAQHFIKYSTRKVITCFRCSKGCKDKLLLEFINKGNDDVKYTWTPWSSSSTEPSGNTADGFSETCPPCDSVSSKWFSFPWSLSLICRLLNSLPSPRFWLGCWKLRFFKTHSFKPKNLSQILGAPP